MSSPLLASLIATTSVATQQQIPIAPMATAAAVAVTAAAAYSARFQMIIDALLERFTADLGLVQFWTLPNCQEWSGMSKQQLRHTTVQTRESPCSVIDASLEGFRLKCCEQGIKGEAMGMLGKAWSTGALMMVQVADTLPKGFHPRTKLEGGERVGEVVFIPVYDRAFPDKGVRAVMEVMMQQGAAEPMAEVITYISSALNLLQLSLKQPHPDRQHPYGSSRLPVHTPMQVCAPWQQTLVCSGPPCMPAPVAHQPMAASPFAQCPPSLGSSFQHPALCMPAGKRTMPSLPDSRVASPTSVLGGDSMLVDENLNPAQRVNSMSRTVSMQCLPHSWEQDAQMQPAQWC